jgi:hypothetical protein
MLFATRFAFWVHARVGDPWTALVIFVLVAAHCRIINKTFFARATLI